MVVGGAGCLAVRTAPSGYRVVNKGSSFEGDNDDDSGGSGSGAARPRKSGGGGEGGRRKSVLRTNRGGCRGFDIRGLRIGGQGGAAAAPVG